MCVTRRIRTDGVGADPAVVGSTRADRMAAQNSRRIPPWLRLAAPPVGMYLRSASQPRYIRRPSRPHLPARIPHSATSLLEVACPLVHTTPGSRA